MARKHSPAALAIALLPFVAMCFSVSWWDRIEPVVLGLPFNLFWLICWQALTALCLRLAYRLESAHEHNHGATPGELP